MIHQQPHRHFHDRLVTDPAGKILAMGAVGIMQPVGGIRGEPVPEQQPLRIGLAIHLAGDPAEATTATTLPEATAATTLAEATAATTLAEATTATTLAEATTATTLAEATLTATLATTLATSSRSWLARSIS